RYTTTRHGADDAEHFSSSTCWWFARLTMALFMCVQCGPSAATEAVRALTSPASVGEHRFAGSSLDWYRGLAGQARTPLECLCRALTAAVVASFARRAALSGREGSIPLFVAPA